MEEGTIMERKDEANWSDLPAELLSMIGNLLDAAPTDVLRFRSICNSWRSSLAFHQTPLPLPLKFPCPFGTDRDAFLWEISIYRINLPPTDPNSDVSTSCLVRIDETKPDTQARWVREITATSNDFPWTVSLLDVPMEKVGKSNGLNYVISNFSMVGVSKVVRYPESTPLANSGKNCSIFVIFDGGKLGFANHEDQRPTLVNDEYDHYDDMKIYKGQLYVVDRVGTVWWVQHPSLKLTQYSPPLLGCSSGNRKHLVESCGDLYVVDAHFVNNLERNAIKGEGPSVLPPRGGPTVVPRHHHGPRIRINANVRRDIARGKTADVRVYKLDETWGKWTEVTDLGDRAFVLSDDICFSVSVSQFGAWKPNCIYFKDKPDSNLFSYFKDGRIFNLADRSFHEYRWSWPVCFFNPYLNRKLWLLDCSTPSQMELRTSMEPLRSIRRLPRGSVCHSLV